MFVRRDFWSVKLRMSVKLQIFIKEGCWNTYLTFLVVKIFDLFCVCLVEGKGFKSKLEKSLLLVSNCLSAGLTQALRSRLSVFLRFVVNADFQHLPCVFF